MVSAPTHEGLSAVAHHETSLASTNEDEISCIRAAFEVRLLQRLLARLGPGEGDESEKENSSVDPGEWSESEEENCWVDSVVWDEGQKDGWAAIARWLSVNDGCRASISADGVTDAHRAGANRLQNQIKIWREKG